MIFPQDTPTRLEKTMSYLTIVLVTLSSSLALAHPGHGASVFHTHSWEIGLGLVVAIAAVGFAVHALRGRK